MDEKENNIDTFLKYLNEFLEEHGHKIQNYFWDFSSNKEELKKILSETKFTEEILCRTIRLCNARNYVKHAYMCGEFDGVALTVQGQARAVSVTRGNNILPQQQSGMTIGNMTINGPAQVGNGNSMNIENAFNEIISAIDASKGSQEEKEEAKSRFARFLEHPLVASIVGGAASGLVSKL